MLLGPNKKIQVIYRLQLGTPPFLVADSLSLIICHYQDNLFSQFRHFIQQSPVDMWECLEPLTVDPGIQGGLGGALCWC